LRTANTGLTSINEDVVQFTKKLKTDKILFSIRLDNTSWYFDYFFKVFHTYPVGTPRKNGTELPTFSFC